MAQTHFFERNFTAKSSEDKNKAFKEHYKNNPHQENQEVCANINIQIYNAVPSCI